MLFCNLLQVVKLLLDRSAFKPEDVKSLAHEAAERQQHGLSKLCLQWAARQAGVNSAGAEDLSRVAFIWGLEDGKLHLFFHIFHSLHRTVEVTTWLRFAFMSIKPPYIK